MPYFKYESELNASPEKVFQWHESQNALASLTPPWTNVEIVQPPESLEVGTKVILNIKFGPFKIKWVARHTEYVAGKKFVDIQEKGPFKKWTHEHRMEPIQGGGCRLTDEINWLLPGGEWMSQLLTPFVNHQLKKMFAYRHQVTKKCLESEHE